MRTPPMTIMAIIEAMIVRMGSRIMHGHNVPFFQCPFAFSDSVRGSRIRATEVPSRARPMISSCAPIRLTRIYHFMSAVCTFLSIRPCFLAFHSAHKRVTMSGDSAAGTRIANIPSVSEATTRLIGHNTTKGRDMSRKKDRSHSQPHLHPACCRISVEMFEPTKALMMKGVDIKAETSPRHLRVVMSAMMTWVRSWSPLFSPRERA